MLLFSIIKHNIFLYVDVLAQALVCLIINPLLTFNKIFEIWLFKFLKNMYIGIILYLLFLFPVLIEMVTGILTPLFYSKLIILKWKTWRHIFKNTKNRIFINQLSFKIWIFQKLRNKYTQNVNVERFELPIKLLLNFAQYKLLKPYGYPIQV